MGKEDFKIPVGISNCLTGEKVRYDGGEKRDAFVMEHLGQFFDLKGFCPEVEAGLDVPREPIQLVYRDKKIRAVGIKDPEVDVTRALKKLTDKHANLFTPLCGYILKARSPSCGMLKVPVFKNGKQTGESAGIFAQRLMKQYPCMPVEEAERLADPALLENFVQRVYVMKNWKTLLQKKLTPKRLQDFHHQHKYLILSHRADSYPQLQAMVSKAKKKRLTDTSQDYITLLMRTMKVMPTRKSHAAVLTRLQEKLERIATTDELKALSKSITKFKKGNAPLSEPQSLIEALLKKLDQPSVTVSNYLEPYPTNFGIKSAL